MNQLSDINSRNLFRIPSAPSRKKFAIVILTDRKDLPYKNTVYPSGSTALFVSHGKVYNRVGDGDGAPRFLEAMGSKR